MSLFFTFKAVGVHGLFPMHLSQGVWFRARAPGDVLRSVLGFAKKKKSFVAVIIGQGMAA